MKKKRRKHGRTSALHIQVHFVFKLPKGVTVSAKFAREVFSKWLDDGPKSLPKGIRVKAIHWRKDSATTPAAIAEARQRLKPVFHSAQVDVRL